MAQDLPQRHGTLAHAVQSAWQRAVTAEESRGRERLATARQRASRSATPEALSAEVGQRNGRGGLSETELTLGAPLWWPGQRTAAREAADAEHEAAVVGQQAARWRLAGEVRELAWALAAEEAELLVAREQLDFLTRLASDVERRVRGGDLARSDSLAAEAEMLAARATLEDIEQRTTVARSRWTILTGLEPLRDPSEQVQETASTQGHPEAALARLEVSRAELQARSVRASRRAPLEVGLNLRQEREASGEARTNTVGVALRVPFGPDARSYAAEASALAEVDVTRTSAARLVERQAAEQGTARAALHAAQRQLQAQQSRSTLLRERARLLERSFQAGETPLPELLRARSAAAQAEGDLARQRSAVGLAVARLNQSLGITP